MAIELIDQVVPKNNGDFSIVNSDYIMGGFHEAQNETSRDAIPLVRRKHGMVCYCLSSDRTYQLIGGIENTNWQLYNPSSVQLQDVNNVITSLINRITTLETKVQALEESLSKSRAIVGTFKAGELRVNEGLQTTASFEVEKYDISPLPSSLSTNFKKKLKK